MNSGRSEGGGANPALIALILALSAGILIAAAWLRSFEYDEAYSFFVTAGTARPVWPAVPFTAGSVRAAFTGSASFASIAQELRQTDVHPPLYFWALHVWQMVVGHSLFVARMLSVLFGLGSLVLVGGIAREARIPANLAMLLTLGCYGFAYTSSIARGFALAELLMLSGVLLALIAARRCAAPVSCVAGLLLGAASFANYLASFAGGAAVLWLVVVRPRQPRLWLGAAIGLLVWVPADLWFFLAQRNSRTGQFPAFEWLPGLVRLARYAAGAVLGGLPLYVSRTAQPLVGGALAAGLVLLVGIIWLRWRVLGRAEPRLLLSLGAVATPVGLILLGVVFDNTPIELRYFSFSVPFFALLIAAALASMPRTAALAGGAVLVGLQVLAIAGLLVRPETMQPARATASAAAALVGPHGLVLLARGNDGVGVVGPFLYEAPDWLPVLLVGRDTSPDQIHASVGGVSRVVLATTEPDADSRTAVRSMRAAVSGPCWRRSSGGFDTVSFDRVCDELRLDSGLSSTRLEYQGARDKPGHVDTR